MEKHSSDKKNAQCVKEKLMQATRELTVEQGWDNFSLEAVATRAGVSKGGLFHYFHNKQVLLDSLADEIVEYVDRHIGETMSKDPNPTGRFVRAYLMLPLEEEDNIYGKLMVSASLSSTVNVELKEKWDKWLNRRMPPEDQTIKNLIVKYAADGLWFDQLYNHPLPQAKKGAIKSRLIEFSRTAE